MSDPRPDNLISPNELFFEIGRLKRSPFKYLLPVLQRAATTINYFEERLEARAKDGRMLPESCDGIGCRDETIQLLEARIAKLKVKTLITDETP